MRIVIGMDGSDNAKGALRWAVEEADVHGASVQALLVSSYLDQQHTDPAAPFDPRYDEAAAKATSSSTWCSAPSASDTQVPSVAFAAASSYLGSNGAAGSVCCWSR